MTSDLQEILSALLDDPSAHPSADWVAEMASSHPAFLIPAAIMLRRCSNELDTGTRDTLRARVMLGCADRTAMADLAGEDWGSIYPPAEPPLAPSTDCAIETFLDHYGQSSPQEDQLLERLIFNPVPADYFPGLDGDDNPSDGTPLLPPELDRRHAQDPPQAADDTQEPLHIPDTATEEPETATPHHAPAEDSLLSESLAKIFIKQRRYQRAYEIISNLSLKFPEKSIYFADQMRFLQKLIYNQQHTSCDNQP